MISDKTHDIGDVTNQFYSA